MSNFRRALTPAIEGEVDMVIHAGDVFDRPEPPPAIADVAYGLLRAVAERGVPVCVVPGNHERARLPCALLSRHPNLWVFDRPRTYCHQVGHVRVAVGGFPYQQRVRETFVDVVAQTGLADAQAAIRVLALHHCVEGARVSLPDGGDYVFRDARDVIAAADLPVGVAAVVSGHVHRHQVLRHRTPVVYCGSVERTAFAEMRETKGYVRLDFAPDNRVADLTFCPLPARPMVRVAIDPLCGVPQQVARALADAAPDAIVRFEVDGEPRTVAGLRASELRAAAPPTMNVHVVFSSQSAMARSRLWRSAGRGGRGRPRRGAS